MRRSWGSRQRLMGYRLFPTPCNTVRLVVVDIRTDDLQIYVLHKPCSIRTSWWNLSRRGSVRKHPSMQHLAPGLCLEQTPKPIFGPCYGASRPLLYARPIPFVISLPLSYSSAMSHSPILTLDSSMPHPNGHASPLSLSRAAYYNSKRDSLWYLTIGLIITSTRHVAQ
jgi:hypothetical protein